MRFRERAAKDGEVLRERVDQPAADGAIAGDDAVAGDALLLHAEVGGAVDDELIELLKRAGIKQQRDPLPRRLLPLGVLAFDALLAAAKLALAFAAVQFVEIVPVHNVTFRSAATRLIASVTSMSDGSRVPIDFASRMRASASMASYAAKLSSSVFVTTSMPISASPNSTSPRSSNRCSIDRCRT